MLSLSVQHHINASVVSCKGDLIPLIRISFLIMAIFNRLMIQNVILHRLSK
jgi:hypothetical protein